MREAVPFTADVCAGLDVCPGAYNIGMQSEEAPEFQKSWLDFHVAVPGWLYHYTTAEGLLGILRDRSMFGTHYRFLNDPLEIVWGVGLVAQHIEEYIRTAEEPIKVVLRQFQGLPIEKYWDIYVACFCAEGNLLSQWRAYGKSGGYSLAFRGRELQLAQLPERRLRRVIYDGSEQDRWVRLALEWFVHKIAAIRRSEDGVAAVDVDAILEVSRQMWVALCEMCISFKLHVFEEESEWRVFEIVPKRATLSDVSSLKFRSKAGILVPYRAFPTERATEAQRIQPLDYIECGPTLSREDVEQSLLMFLRSEGYSGVWVRSSMIPIKPAFE